MKKIELYGTEYASIKSAARAHGGNYKTLWNRLRRPGKYRLHDVELLASVADLTGTELQFIGLDGQARYKVPWSKTLQTTRQMIAHYRPKLVSLYDKGNPDGTWNPLVKGE